MTSTIEVRDLSVLFGGGTREMLRSRGVISGVLLDAETEAQMKRFPGYDLGLPGVTFSVNSGDCLAVLGESGSGKSSLLRTLAGLQPTSGGVVRVNGQDVSALPPERRGIVYLHQVPVLFPHLSVLDNVAFPMTVRGVSARDAAKRAFEWLVRLQVHTVAGADPDALSGGQRHRVALARALCADPAVLLLDEPLASLDPAVRRDVRVALQAAREASGAAMLLVTHDLDDALSVATHIATIDGFGRLSAPLPTKAMLDSPPSLAAARLLGTYAEIAGVVHETDAGSVLRWIGGELVVPGSPPGDVIACVRAHEVRVHRGDQLDAPVLTVVGRSDTAHDTLLTVQDPTGARAEIRIGSGTALAVGDVVQLVLRQARIFSPG